MMKRRLYYMACLLAAFFAVGCEDLEDTYSEYAGDGMIRYVGKSSRPEIAAGWNRLQVIYRSNLDATIKKVKIVCQSDDICDTIYRDQQEILKHADMVDTVYFTGLEDGLYTVKVSCIAEDGSESIAEQMTGRPYTERNENLRTFSRGILNFYPFREQGKMVVCVDAPSSDMLKMLFRYTDKQGQPHEWDIRKNMGKELCYMFPDNMFRLPEEEGVEIDFTKPLVIDRKGMLSDCIDTISFELDTLNPDEQVWSADFTRLMTKNYGTGWKSEVENITEIELDYDMATFQDLYYFPRLQKVVLGKNRYMMEEYQNYSSLTDVVKALVTLQYLKDIRGVTAEVYNKHYVFDEYYGYPIMEMLSDPMWGAPKIEADLVALKGNHFDAQPAVALPDVTDWKVTCSDTTFNGTKDYGAGWLLDDDPMTYFETGQKLNGTIYEVKIDMNTLRSLSGFKVSQPAVAGSGTTADIKKALKYLQSALKIEVSKDDMQWEDVAYDGSGITIGNNIGEVTYIGIPEALRAQLGEVRYVRVTLANRQVDDIDGLPTFRLRLGDFIPY